MHYYIYPKNWDGEDIVYNLSLISPLDTFSFIDDSVYETSLEALSEGIRSNENARVLLVSKYRYADLANKCESYGITNYCEGLSFAAKAINAYFRDRIAEIGSEYGAVGFSLPNLPHSSHAQGLIEILEHKNIPIVFFVKELRLLTRYEETYPNALKIIVRCDLLEHLDFVDIMFVIGARDKIHSNILSIINPQGLLDPIQNYFYLSKSHSDCLIGSRINFDYILTHSKAMGEYYASIYKSLIHPRQLYGGGYMSLDAYRLDYKPFASKPRVPSKTVIVAFTIIGSESIRNNNCDVTGLSPELLDNLVASLLENDYKVVFRPHPEKEKSLWREDIAEKFKTHKNFVYDITPRMTADLMYEAVSIISNLSSVGQTFPLTTYKPAVIYLPNKDFLEQIGVSADIVANPKTHILTHSIEGILQALSTITQNLENYEKSCKEYCEEQIFNLDNSSRAIADFILELLEQRRRVSRV